MLSLTLKHQPPKVCPDPPRGGEFPGSNRGWCLVDVINELIKPDPPRPTSERVGVRDLEFWHLCQTTSQLIIPFVFFDLKAFINNLWARISSFGGDLGLYRAAKLARQAGIRFFFACLFVCMFQPRAVKVRIFSQKAKAQWPSGNCRLLLYQALNAEGLLSRPS